MNPNKDWFNTYFYIYLILAIVVPLLFVVSLYLKSKTVVTIDVVQPQVQSPSINPIQSSQITLRNSGQQTPENIGLTGSNSTQYQVNYTIQGIDAPVININSGDAVVFNNLSLQPVIVVANTWGSIEQIPPTKSFVQKFDFAGEYSYQINGLYGKIVVN